MKVGSYQQQRLADGGRRWCPLDEARSNVSMLQSSVYRHLLQISGKFLNVFLSSMLLLFKGHLTRAGESLVNDLRCEVGGERHTKTQNHSGL